MCVIKYMIIKMINTHVANIIKIKINTHQSLAEHETKKHRSIWSTLNPLYKKKKLQQILTSSIGSLQP